MLRFRFAFHTGTVSVSSLLRLEPKLLGLCVELLWSIRSGSHVHADEEHETDSTDVVSSFHSTARPDGSFDHRDLYHLCLVQDGLWYVSACFHFHLAYADTTSMRVARLTHCLLVRMRRNRSIQVACWNRCSGRVSTDGHVQGKRPHRAIARSSG